MTPDLQVMFDELITQINYILDTEISKAIDDMMLNYLLDNDEIWDDVCSEFDYDELD